MTEVAQAVDRGQFIRNTAKGGLVLAGAGGVLASAQGVAFAKGVTKGDLETLQVAYIAESLAVHVYTTIIKDFHKFRGLQNRDYFTHALANEKEHKKILGEALGSKKPKGFHLHIPKSAVRSTHALTKTGAALELAFVKTYLGAVRSFSSTDLKLLAAQFGADEATHYSFFDAAAGGHAVLPAVTGTLGAKHAARILKKDGFIS